ncbi:MAG TPA: asparaginase [Gaiellaceae bacterium]|nr:asparaginase [Gaiellaceae bacterium]
MVVVSTGGTISMRPDPATGKLVPAVSGDELVEMLAWPEAPPLELDDFVRVPSFDVHGELALSLARRVAEHAGGGSPTVVTHGTDTMEESVYLADLLLPAGAAPVVFTGAQRGAEERDADGPRNLRDAILVATAAEAAGRGALVAFAGEVHAAREARKVHTSAVRAFASPGYGPLGHVDAGAVRFRRSPERRPALPVPERLAPVDLIRLHAGSDARFVRAAVESGVRAVVIEGTGRGNANDQVVEGVREAVAAGVVVVVCSRCAEGRVEPVYGRGGGRDLAEAGALFAGDLAGPKARVLLQVALGAGLDAAEALAAAS